MSAAPRSARSIARVDRDGRAARAAPGGCRCSRSTAARTRSSRPLLATYRASWSSVKTPGGVPVGALGDRPQPAHRHPGGGGGRQLDELGGQLADPALAPWMLPLRSAAPDRRPPCPASGCRRGPCWCSGTAPPGSSWRARSLHWRGDPVSRVGVPARGGQLAAGAAAPEPRRSRSRAGPGLSAGVRERAGDPRSSRPGVPRARLDPADVDLHRPVGLGAVGRSATAPAGRRGPRTARSAAATRADGKRQRDPCPRRPTRTPPSTAAGATGAVRLTRCRRAAGRALDQSPLVGVGQLAAQLVAAAPRPPR